MSDSAISVLITFYNKEQYVDRAIESVINQKTSFDFKIIVGDDGSTDNTRDYVNRWIEKYPGKIELYVMTRDEGKQIPGFRASKNRLNILNKVDTKYFTFLDGDDYYSDINKLQIQYDILEKSSNFDCIGCGHNMEALLDDGSIKKYTNDNIAEGKYDLKSYWDKYYISAETILFRSSIINKFDNILLEKQFNDNMITYIAMQFGYLYYIPSCMYIYRQTGDGVWTTGNQITNNIRNMFLYDLSLIINPQIRYLSDRRFSVTWKNLLHMRKEIDSDKYVEYISEAKDKNLIYSYQWLNYNSLSFFIKFKLLLKARCIIFKHYCYYFVKLLKIK